jgi:hypothetical protein
MAQCRTIRLQMKLRKAKAVIVSKRCKRVAVIRGPGGAEERIKGMIREGRPHGAEASCVGVGNRPRSRGRQWLMRLSRTAVELYLVSAALMSVTFTSK